MELILIVLALMAMLCIVFYIKKTKESLKGSLVKLFVFVALFAIALILLSAHYNLAGFFSEDSAAVRTGAAIVDAIKKNLR